MDLAQVFEETLEIAENGCYAFRSDDGSPSTVSFPLPNSEYRKVFTGSSLATGLDSLWKTDPSNKWEKANPCVFEVTNEDSLSCAARMIEMSQLKHGREENPPLVLNFANPVVPGGGVREGARAQEEDMCRRSTLYLSLTSDDASRYYEKNETYSDYLYSDDLLVSPCVEVFRDERNELLSSTFTVAVLTMAAPIARYMTDKSSLGSVIRHRAVKILTTAKSLGYSRLVLGAWGCGAFGNDARLVSQAFFEAFQEFEDKCGFAPGEAFSQVCFAILQKDNSYNFNMFREVFDHYYALRGEGVAEEYFKERTFGFGYPLKREASQKAEALPSEDNAPEEIKKIDDGLDGPLFDRYRILRRIGRGGFSEVFLAYDQHLERSVVIKRLDFTDFDFGENLLQDTMKSIKLRLRLNLPSRWLPNFYDIIRKDRVLYIVMEYVDGETLKELVKREGPQDPQRVSAWMQELCSLLGGLHEMNPPLIHRDVKPANIILASDNHIRLIDGEFLREYKEGQEHDTLIIGTRGHAAPEQLNRTAQTDARSDIYAMGATMWYLLLGKSPRWDFFPEGLYGEDSLVDAEMGRIIKKCMEFDPEDRYQSCNELSEDLSRYLREGKSAVLKRGLFGRKDKGGAKKSVLSSIFGAIEPKEDEELGGPTIIFCPSCGHEVLARSGFCENCGRSLKYPFSHSDKEQSAAPIMHCVYASPDVMSSPGRAGGSSGIAGKPFDGNVDERCISEDSVANVERRWARHKGKSPATTVYDAPDFSDESSFEPGA